MRIPEYVISDLKGLGKNHLIAVGFALTGFTVAYSVNKACRWFFQMQDDAKKMRSEFVGLIVAGLGLQASVFLGNIVNIRNDHCTVNPRILVFHIAAFAIASLGDSRKIVRAGIALSAASVCLPPMFMGAAGACLGGLSAKWEDFF